MPRPWCVACVDFTGQACGREVTVGDAPAVALGTFRVTIRRSIGERALLMPDVSDAMVDAVLRMWPVEWATNLARSKSFEAGQAFYRLTILVHARCREYLEWRYGTSNNVLTAIDLLLMHVVDEVAMFWLEGALHRNIIRRSIAEARRAD
jgi:hypothetical protein